uniref:protein acetyllysine N-acetyltransferase n=1 Tax=Mola mola TaxID=94237 RepID=A0A3Q3WMM2_MOLML
MAEEADSGVSSRVERKALQKARIVQRESERKIFRLLKKPESERSEEEAAVLALHRGTVEELCRRQDRSNVVKRKQEEVFDDADELKSKIRQLAVAVKQAKHLVLYTGAGISTFQAASIPDYRGPNGVWTQLQKGRTVSSDLSKAEPTLTHMCIRMLQKEQLVKHVVSQNCDGLHLRSGLPRQALSELHGNMFIEQVCTSCSPIREYVRLFDVTERTSLHRHGTGRRCSHCGSELRDTIVHFGERGTLEQPLNWKGAAEAAGMADVIVCLGSSLKVLKKYACLWCMNRSANKRPKLYIVNLQWTPKDDLAVLKIHGKCDEVMSLLMEELNLQVPVYDDPIFSLATPLQPDEVDSSTRELIAPPHEQEDSSTGPGEPSQETTAVQGGWFGRGYGKGRKK